MTETFTIRRASPKDAAAYARLMNDPAVFGGLLQMPARGETEAEGNGGGGHPEVDV